MLISNDKLQSVCLVRKKTCNERNVPKKAEIISGDEK